MPNESESHLIEADELVDLGEVSLQTEGLPIGAPEGAPLFQSMGE